LAPHGRDLQPGRRDVTEVVRLLLAVVFAVAGTAKLADLRGAAQAAQGFGAPRRAAGPVALLVALAELAIAAALVPAVSARPAAAAAAALVALFTVAIAVSLLRGRTPDCHCFGQLHSAPAGPATLARNTALGALAVLVASQPADHPTPLEFAAAGVAIVVAAQALLSFTLLRRYGRALERIGELGAAADRPAPLAVGAEAPRFELADAHGRPVALDGLLARRLPVLLVFTDPQCGPCRALLPRLGEWQRERAGQLTVAAVSRGDRDLNLELADEHGIETLLVQEDGEVAAAYRALATPSAIVVGADGLIAHPLVGGASAIEDIVRSTAPPVEERKGGSRALAPAAALAGGLALTAATAHASARQAADPELQAIRTTLLAAGPRITAATRRASLALRAQTTVRTGSLQRQRRAAAVKALAAQRREVVALRVSLDKLVVAGATAHNVKTLTVYGLSLFARSLQWRERALVAGPAVARRQLNQSQKLLLDSLVPLANASELLARS
jgi:peroxiredoxin/uncharacterized membrane protein YphA (DoxX/SURF4 family)